MDPQTPYPNSTASTSTDEQNQDLHLDHDENGGLDHAHMLKTELDDHDEDGDLDEDENVLNYVADPFYCMDNNPPESYAVCQAKVADWLTHHTYIERKASVKFANPCQTGRSSHRSVSLNQKPKLSIIGFRKKPVHHHDGKSKQNDKVENVRLFRNRSEPGRDYCLLITEPVSPRVSCVGRVGSVRVHGRKAGVWRSFKAAFSNMVHTNRMTKIAA